MTSKPATVFVHSPPPVLGGGEHPDDYLVHYKGHIVSLDEDSFLLQTFSQKILSFPQKADQQSLLGLYQLGQYAEVDVWEDMPHNSNTVACIRVAEPSASAQTLATQASKTLSLEDTLYKALHQGSQEWVDLIGQSKQAEAVLSLRQSHNLPPSMALGVVKLFMQYQTAQDQAHPNTAPPSKLVQAVPTFASWLHKKKN